MAKPSAGSTRSSACRTKDPVTGNNADTSPRANCTAQTTSPTSAYPRRAPSGPPSCRAPPRLRKRPVPWQSQYFNDQIWKGRLQLRQPTQSFGCDAVTGIARDRSPHANPRSVPRDAEARLVHCYRRWHWTRHRYPTPERLDVRGISRTLQKIRLTIVLVGQGAIYPLWLYFWFS